MKNRFTTKTAESTPNGGVLIGKKQNVELIHDKGKLGGYLVGRPHSKQGIKAINKSTGQDLEMEGGEVVITQPAVEDLELREFEGEMLTNRQILSKINESGGGVSFAEGGEIPTEFYYYGNSYKYGGETLTDYEIAKKISSCGCEHKNDGLSQGMTLNDLADLHNVSLEQILNQVKKGLLVESEHTSDEKLQLQIAKDHLLENPYYYDILESAKLEKGGELNSKFENIEKLILQELNNRNLLNEYRITSKSITDYGESWYMKFHNDLEIRISDHSVQSIFRVFDDKYIDFINVYSTYNPEIAVFTINKYVEKTKEIKEKTAKLKTAEKKLQERIDYIKEKSKSFLSELKNKNKGVFFHGFTRIEPSNFIIKYPNSELIFPISVNGGYEYYYVGPNNFFSKKGLSPEYFNFLVEKGIIEANQVSEQILYESGGKLKKGSDTSDLQNLAETSDTLLDGPDIVAAETTLFSDGGEIDKNQINLQPTNPDELKESLEYVHKNMPFDKTFLGMIQSNYFENIVINNPKKHLTEYYDAIQVLPKTKQYLYENVVSDVQNINSDDEIIKKLDDNPYNYLPSELKPLPKVKKLDFSPTPDNVNLGKITDLFTGNDVLRPIMSGTFFNLEDNRIEATNAHILLFINEKPHVSESCICLMGKRKEWFLKKKTEMNITENSDGCWKLEGNYMKTGAVIPFDYSDVITVDAIKLLQYAKASQYFSNGETRQLTIVFKNDEGIQFRHLLFGFLSDCLEAMIMLGYDEVDFCFSEAKNRAIAIVPKGNSRKVSYSQTNTDLVLLMPSTSYQIEEIEPVYNLQTNEPTLYYKTKLVQNELENELENEEVVEVLENLKPADLPNPIEKTKTETISEQQEILDTIAGLEILIPSLKGKDKIEAKDTIFGLKLILELDTFDKGGEINKENDLQFKPIETQIE